MPTIPDGPRERPWTLIAIGIALLSFFALDRWTATFVREKVLRPALELPIAPLRDRTSGTNPLLLFDVLDATYRSSDINVFILGDSSVFAVDRASQLSLPAQLQDALRSRLGPRIRVVDFSLLGNQARDSLALFLAAREYSPDLLLFAVNPRIFRSDSLPEEIRNDATMVIGARVESLRTPGNRVFDELTAETVGSNFARGHIAMLRQAGAIKRALFEQCVQSAPFATMHNFCTDNMPPLIGTPPPLVAADGFTIGTHKAAPAAPPPSPGFPPAFSYFRAQFDFDGSNAAAFRAMVENCREDGKCVLYRSPLNLECTTGFEPSLLQDFRSFLADTTDGVRVIDLEGALTRDQFREKTRYGSCDALHLNDAGAHRLGELLAEQIAPLLAPLHDAGVRGLPNPR